jgi:hypothetical protein
MQGLQEKIPKWSSWNGAFDGPYNSLVLLKLKIKLKLRSTVLPTSEYLTVNSPNAVNFLALR